MLLSFDKSAYKHGVSQDEIKEIFADPNVQEFDLEPSKQGNYRVMYVGFTLSGKLLEVGVECIDSPQEIFLHIYHADQATAKYRTLFNQVR